MQSALSVFTHFIEGEKKWDPAQIRSNDRHPDAWTASHLCGAPKLKCKMDPELLEENEEFNVLSRAELCEFLRSRGKPCSGTKQCCLKEPNFFDP